MISLLEHTQMAGILYTYHFCFLVTIVDICEIGQIVFNYLESTLIYIESIRKVSQLFHKLVTHLLLMRFLFQTKGILKISQSVTY